MKQRKRAKALCRPTTWVNIVLNATPEQRALIDRAAELMNKPVQDFIMEAVMRRARNAINDLDPVVRQKWLDDNAGFFKAYNERIAKDGLPLEEYRMF